MIDDSDIPVAIIIIAIAIIVIGFLIATIFFCVRKNKRRNAVTFLDANNDKALETHNNSHALPEYATDEVILPSHRSESKTSDRKMMQM